MSAVAGNLVGGIGAGGSGSGGAEGADVVASLRGVGVRFGRTQALTGIDLDVARGGFTAVIGADGAGKSTLLRVLAGLRKPSEGTFQISVPKVEMGFSGSEFDLYSDLTVRENLRFFSAVRGMGEAEYREAVERILDMVGMTEAADRLAGALSGGMKKKLGLAAALIYEPALLLLDEPTVGVDPTSRRELWGIVAQAHAAGTTVVFTTTYLDEAERASRVVLLSEGRATEFSPELLARFGEGWQVWVLPEEARRNDLRVALARAGLDARVYLRPEGLAVIARSRAEAEERVAVVLAALPGGAALPGAGGGGGRSGGGRSGGTDGPAGATDRAPLTDSGAAPEGAAPLTDGAAPLPGGATALQQARLSLDDLFVLVQMGLADREEPA